MTPKPTTTIVVIGGSYAGLGVSHQLLQNQQLLEQQQQQPKDIKVILINPSNEFCYNVASPRFLTKANLIPEEKYIYSIPDAFKKYPAESFQFIQGKASHLDLENRNVSVQKAGDKPAEDVKYDYLVIASGSTTPATVGRESYPAPFKAPVELEGDLRGGISRTQDAIRDAKSILIGGAGPVGVEFAGELVDAFGGEAKKEITMVFAEEKPLAGIKEGAQDAAAQLLRDKGVTLKASCLIESAEYDESARKWSVTLKGGESLTADLYVSAMGTIPNNEFIPAELLDGNGWARVDKHLHALNGQGDVVPNVYALGDISSHQEKLLMRVPSQITAVSSNLKRDITGSGELTAYLPEHELNAMLVPIGKSTGTGVIAGWRVWGFLVSFLKGRDFMVGKAASFVAG